MTKLADWKGRQRGMTLVEVMVVMVVMAVIAFGIFYLLMALFNSSLIAGQTLNQQSSMQTTQRFFSQRLSTTQLGSIGTSGTSDASNISASSIGGDQFVFDNDHTCYRVFYLAATQELRVATSADDDPKGLDASSPPSGYQGGGGPCFNIAPTWTLKTTGQTKTCGPSQYGTSACSGDPVLDNSTDLNSKSFTLATNVSIPTSCSGPPNTNGSAQVPAAPCSPFLYYAQGKDGGPISFNTGSEDGPDLNASNTSTNSWYRQSASAGSIDAVGFDIVIGGSSQADTPGYQQAGAALFARTFFIGEPTGGKRTAPTAATTQLLQLNARLATAGALPNHTATSSALTGVDHTPLTVDGVATNLSDQILVKNEADPTQNGLYTLTSQGQPDVPPITTAQALAGMPVNLTLKNATDANKLSLTQWGGNAGQINGSGWSSQSSGATSIPDALSKMTMTDTLQTSSFGYSSPLSSNWSLSSYGNGEVSGSLWGSPFQGYGSPSGWVGNYWNASKFTDSGNGDAAQVTLTNPPGNGQYTCLWLNMPTAPTGAGTFSGYEVYIVGTATAGYYGMYLVKWTNGAGTNLWSGGVYLNAAHSGGSTIALVRAQGWISIYAGTDGTNFSGIYGVQDGGTSYNSGYAGLQGYGGNWTVDNFKAGALTPIGGGTLNGTTLANTPVTDPLNSATKSSGWANLTTGSSWKGPSPIPSGGAPLTTYGGAGSFTTSGWKPACYGSASGDYWNSSLSAAGGSMVSMVTDNLSSDITDRYVSLWAGMPSPGGSSQTTAQQGYQLVWIDTASTAVWQVRLVKWVNGNPTVLAQNNSVSVPVNTSFALVVDKSSGTVSGWWNTGSTFTQIPGITANDTTYQSGYAGLEGSGCDPYLRNFTAASLATGGSGLSSVYYNPAPITPNDSGGGIAAETTYGATANSSGQYGALWAAMPSPGSTQSGYELSWTNTSGSNYQFAINKWVNGVETQIGSTWTATSSSFAAGDKVALVVDGSTVKAYISHAGGAFLQIASIGGNDSTFSSGYSGIEGNNPNGFFSNFSTGPLTTNPGVVGHGWELTRTVGADDGSDWTPGELVTVSNGVNNANTIWQLTTPKSIPDGGIIFGQTPFGFTQQFTDTKIPAGTIMPMAIGNGSGSATAEANQAPEGYLYADGSAYSVSQYPKLYAAIGTTYGGVAGSWFQVPDLRGKRPVGSEDTTQAGAGPNGVLGSYVYLGQSAGAYSNQLNTSQLPPLQFSVSGSVGVNISERTDIWLLWVNLSYGCEFKQAGGATGLSNNCPVDGDVDWRGGIPASGSNGVAQAPGSGSSDSGWISGSTNALGGGGTFDQTNPYQAIGWIIKY